MFTRQHFGVDSPHVLLLVHLPSVTATTTPLMMMCLGITILCPDMGVVPKLVRRKKNQSILVRSLLIEEEHAPTDLL